MIDIKKAKQEFIKYRNIFNKNNQNIERKFKHSFDVMKLSEEIAIDLNLNKEQIELAKLIGLLHDIGRFTEYKRVKKEKTFFNTNKFNHAIEGVKILKNKDYIREFIYDNQYDRIIFSAIINHNKNSIEKSLSKEEELFTRILRDADKLDILRLSVTVYWKNNMKEVEEGEISKEVLKENLSLNTICTKKININKHIDKLVSTLSLIYDLNYRKSFQILKKEDYFNKIINRFNFKNEITRKEMNIIKTIGNQFINSKI